MQHNKDKKCRGCLEQTCKFISIFEFCCVDSNNFRISELFQKCTNLDINDNDELPDKICENCLVELISVHRFQEKCQNSDAMLRSEESICDFSVEMLVEDHHGIDPVNDGCYKEEYLKEEESDTEIEMLNINETVDDTLIGEKNYICLADGCNKTFTSISNFNVHKKTHDPEQGFKCDYCDKVFPRHIMKLNHHRIHTNERSFKCSVCPEAKTTKSGLLNHLLTHTHKLRCDICDMNFKTRRLELLHMKRHRQCTKHIEAQRELNANRRLDKNLALVHNQIDKIRSNSLSKKKNVRTQCEICKLECFTSAGLRDHLVIHNQTTEYETTTNSSIIDESGTKFKCLECEKIFTSLISFREHRKIHNPECAVKCDYCDKIFSSKAKREPHHRTHRGERPHKCSVCPEARSTKSSLLKHLLCHARSLKCKPCAISFESSRSYVAHMKIHEVDSNYEPNNDTPDPDDELDENQLRLKQQIEDIRSTTLAQKRNINTKCTVCYREFATPSELKSHAEVHRNVGDYLCTICGKTSLTKAGYREHLFVHESSGTFQCEHCDKVCSSSHQLKAHVRKHTGEKPYLCNICGKSFSSSNVLLVHNRLHTGEKPFKCIADGCTAAFRTTSKLNRHHIVMHSTIRPYECSVCTKKFAFSDEYKAHAATHSNETAYECGMCGKGFMKDYYLKLHLRVHTGEKPYKCDLCSKPFRLRSSLNSHMKWKHKSESGVEKE